MKAEYTAYGAAISGIGANAAGPRLWGKEDTDPVTGLVYLHSRFYNPRLMQFMQKDTWPVDNLYSFGNGDPINNVDPSGHFPVNATLAVLTVGAYAMSVTTGCLSQQAEDGADWPLIMVGGGLAVVGAVTGIAVSKVQRLSKKARIAVSFSAGVVFGAASELLVHMGETGSWDNWARPFGIGAAIEGVSNFCMVGLSYAWDACSARSEAEKPPSPSQAKEKNAAGQGLIGGSVR